jgi:hypothetical protein
MTDTTLDGNATAGTFTDVFAFDITLGLTTCAECRHTAPIATLHAYVQAPGVVLRCSACDAVQVRYVRSHRTAWLDLRGAHVLQIQLPIEAPPPRE